MGPRSLLPIDLGALMLALVGAGAVAIPLVALAFVVGVVAGAVVALTLAWHAMTPNFRLLVRASFHARRGGLW